MTKSVNKSTLEVLVIISSITIVVTGLLSLFGNLSGINWLVGVWKTNYTAASMISSLLFIVIGILITLRILFPNNRWVRTISIIIYFSIIAYCIQAVFFYDNTKFGDIHLNQGAIKNILKPFSAILFLISSLGVILNYWLGKKLVFQHIISILGSLVMVLAFSVLLGYVFGSPLIMAGKLMAISINSALGFFFLGGAIIGLGGSNTIFAKPFTGVSSSALVLRVFLPLIISGILFEAFMYELLTHYFSLNADLVISVLKTVSILLTSIIIIGVSRFVFKKAELAEKERRISEERVQQERIMLRTLIDNLPDTIYVKDNNCRKILANRADVKATGFTEEVEILGKTDLEIFRKEDGEHGFAEDRQVIESGMPMIDQENYYQDKSGDEVWLRTSKIPLRDPDGKVIGLVGIGHNITEKRKYEEQMLLLNHSMKSLNDCVSITDIHDNIIYVNDSFCKVYGYGKDELLGKNIKMLRPESVENFTEMILPATINAGWTGEIINKRKDGTLFPVLISTSPVKNEAGEIVALQGIATDITKRKEIEEQLARQTKELLELNSTKDKFFSIIAHDLRSPFNALIGLSDLLANNYHEMDNSDVEESINDIYRASKQAFTLLENLLDWARSQTGRMEYQPVTFNLTELLSQTVSVASAAAENKEIQLSIDGPKDLPVFADKNMIYTVLRNLVSNAIKFTPAKGKITLRSEQTDSEVLFMVEDTGVGISEENIARLFQIDKTFSIEGTAEEKGTGLGLILCKEFIDKHKGKISVKSAPGKGSSFIVSLPK